VTDDLRTIAADLRRYLDQERETGVEWYHDAGPVTMPEPAPQATPAEEKVQPEPVPVKATAKPAAPPADTVKPVGGTMTKEEREVAFMADCTEFVNRTLAEIASRKAEKAPPAEQNMFDASAKNTEDLTVDQQNDALLEMAAEVAACTSCKLHPTRTQTVFGVGNPNANIVFIGEAPGKNEDEQGEPFIGRAGKLLTEILNAIGFERENIYICNILKCRPPQNRDPEADEVRACEPFLKRQLEILQPKVICCLGRHAAMTLLKTRDSLRAIRETVHFYEGVPVMATYHPAALLRNPHWKRDTWDDVRKLRALHDALTEDA
jgi:DNA polymerase